MEIDGGRVLETIHLIDGCLRYCRMTMSNADSDDTGEHIEVSAFQLEVKTGGEITCFPHDRTSIVAFRRLSFVESLFDIG